MPSRYDWRAGKAKGHSFPPTHIADIYPVVGSGASALSEGDQLKFHAEGVFMANLTGLAGFVSELRAGGE